MPFVGVQETRSKLQGHHDSEHYHIVAAPALQDGHCGSQLWVAKCISQGTQHLQIRTSHIRVVGHVPCMPDEHAAQQWWHQTLQDLPWAYRHWPRVMLVDANARLGSLTSDAVGAHQPSDEHAHGEMMHQWLTDNLMLAPQTMEEFHQGPPSTFAHAKGPEGRIAFVFGG